VEAREGGEGGPSSAVGHMGWPATAPDLKVRAALLPHEQRRHRWHCREKVADVWDRGDTGLGGSAWGAGESENESPCGDGAPTGGPGQHSVGAAVQMVF
jgi:hypothetical protein